MKANSLEELVTNSNIAGELRNYTDWHTRLVKFAQLVADWQKEQDERVYQEFFNERNQGDASFRDLLAYKEGHRDGMEEQKEQMLGDAISCEVDWYDGPILNYPIDQLCEVLSKMDIDVGDKVRIVVLKEEDEK